MIENEVDPPNTLNLLMAKEKPGAKLDSTEQNPRLLFSKRFLIVVLLFVFNIILVIWELNANFAVIEMTSNKLATNGSIVQSAEFQWDTKTIGLVLSILAYGKLLSFSSGLFISRVGGATCWALSTIICGFATTLHPICLRYNFHLFLACRFMTGIFHSFTVIGSTELFSHWIPTRERETMISFQFTGIYIGAAIVHPVCGFIADEWGWRMVFYITGMTSMVFGILCLIVVRNSPSEDIWISKAERSYIIRETDVNTSKKVVTRPYRKILACKPVWALFLFNWVNNSTSTILSTSMPFFIKDSTKKGTKDLALISSIPVIVVIFVSFFAGISLDFCRNRSSISQTKMHKILVAVAFTCQMVSLIGLTIAQNLILVIFLFVLISVTKPFASVIKQMVLFGLAPNHSGLLASLLDTWYALGIITTQTVVGFMTTNHTSEEWNRCFVLAAGFLCFGIVTFTLYGSSEPQSWSMSSNSDSKNEYSSFQKKNNCSITS